jgi:hypothetical protein
MASRKAFNRRSKMRNSNHRPIIALRAPIVLRAGSEAQPRRFEIKAYTGKVISSYFGGFVIDIDGIQTKEKVPILREHARDRIVGWSEETRKDGSGLHLSGVFADSTPDGKEVLALADEGFPWQASVGIKALQVKILKNANESLEVNGKKYNGPLEVWTKSLVGETSMVAWGADNDTGMSLLSEDGVELAPVDIVNSCEKGPEKMTFEELKRDYSEVFDQVFKAGAQSMDARIEELSSQIAENERKLADAGRAGVEEERSRCVKLLEAKADAGATLKAIKDGVSAAEAFETFYLAERENRERKKTEIPASLAESVGGQGKPSGSGDGGKTADFWSEVNRFMAEHKCGKAAAVKAVVKDNPALYEQYRKTLRGDN